MPVVRKNLIYILLFLFWFYRYLLFDEVCEPENIIYHPASGYVQKIDETKDTYIVRSFLLVTHHHSQYMPCTATILNIQHHPGKFNFAQRKSDNNERVTTTMNSSVFGKIKVTQISGFMPRTIRNYLKVGDKACRGKLMGMIIFGSRVDTEIPKISLQGKHIELLTKKGQWVQAGETHLAKIR